MCVDGGRLDGGGLENGRFEGGGDRLEGASLGIITGFKTRAGYG